MQSLPGALTALCEVLTSDPHGGPARIPVKLFHRLYSYLADIDGQVSNDQINSVMLFLNTEAYVIELLVQSNVSYPNSRDPDTSVNRTSLETTPC